MIINTMLWKDCIEQGGFEGEFYKMNWDTFWIFKFRSYQGNINEDALFRMQGVKEAFQMEPYVFLMEPYFRDRHMVIFLYIFLYVSLYIFLCIFPVTYHLESSEFRQISAWNVFFRKNFKLSYFPWNPSIGSYVNKYTVSELHR